MRHHNVPAVLLGLGIAAVGVVMSDVLAWMTTHAVRDAGGPTVAEPSAVAHKSVAGQG